MPGAGRCVTAAMINRLYRKIRGVLGGVRFENAALAVVAVSVLWLYGTVLGEATGWLPAPAGIAERAAGTPATAQRVARPQPAAPARAVDTTPWLVEPAGSVSALVELFRRTDYRLDAVREDNQPVPRIIVEEVPDDLHSLGSPTQRKRVFIKLILPLVLYVNEQVLGERQRLVGLRQDIDRFGRIPDPGDRAWLERMRERYGLDTHDIDALLRRVDAIPPSLALAQAAEESGWGTSRFVREANAVFGQYTFATGAGVVPLGRDDGENHEVRSFARLLDSVTAYMFNLNSHPAYHKFRRVREYQRKIRGHIDGYALAGTLKFYSVRRDAYVRTIRAIMKTGGLRTLDRARLGGGATAAASEPDV